MDTTYAACLLAWGTLGRHFVAVQIDELRETVSTSGGITLGPFRLLDPRRHRIRQKMTKENGDELTDKLRDGARREGGWCYGHNSATEQVCQMTQRTQQSIADTT